MDRSEFIRTFVFAPALAGGLADKAFNDTVESTVRRLSGSRNFTTWWPGI